jgi:hypothetical protein
VVVPSNPVGLDAQGNVTRLLPEGQSSGEVVTGWLLEQSGRLEVGGDLHDLVVGPAEARSLIATA